MATTILLQHKKYSIYNDMEEVLHHKQNNKH